MRKTPQKTKAFEDLAKEAGIPSTDTSSTDTLSTPMPDTAGRIVSEEILGISEESKYPKSKGRQNSAAKKRATRVVKPTEEPAVLETAASTSTLAESAEKTPAAKTPRAKQKGKQSGIQPVLPEVFQKVLFSKSNNLSGHELYQALSSYGLLALYNHAGKDSSEDGQRARSEIELRGCTIEQLEAECVNIPQKIMDTAGEQVMSACLRRAKQLDQMTVYANTISEKSKGTAVENSPTLKSLALEYADQHGSPEVLLASTTSQVEFSPADIASQTPAFAYQEPTFNATGSTGVTVIPESLMGSTTPDTTTADIADAETTIPETTTAETTIPGPTTSKTTAGEPTVGEPTVGEPTSEESTIEERMAAESRPEVETKDEYNVSIMDILDAITDLEGYANFIDVVKTIPKWTNLKGIQLYYLMVPVELRIWKVIDKIPPVQAILHDAYELRNDGSFQDCEFGNLTCIYHKMILKWAADNGIFESNPEFIQRRHDIFKVYNSFIVEHLE